MLNISTFADLNIFPHFNEMHFSINITHSRVGMWSSQFEMKNSGFLFF